MANFVKCGDTYINLDRVEKFTFDERTGAARIVKFDGETTVLTIGAALSLEIALEHGRMHCIPAPFGFTSIRALVSGDADGADDLEIEFIRAPVIAFAVRDSGYIERAVTPADTDFEQFYASAPTSDDRMVMIVDPTGKAWIWGCPYPCTIKEFKGDVLRRYGWTASDESLESENIFNISALRREAAVVPFPFKGVGK